MKKISEETFYRATGKMPIDWMISRGTEVMAIPDSQQVQAIEIEETATSIFVRVLV